MVGELQFVKATYQQGGLFWALVLLGIIIYCLYIKYPDFFKSIGNLIEGLK